MFRQEEGKQPATVCLKMVRNKHNTPVIIKYPFWQMTAKNKNAVYTCVNRGEAYCPQHIAHQAICINEDIEKVLDALA